MRTIHRDTVSGLIFSKDGKLFQARHHAGGGGVYSDKPYWHIPGGGIEEGETPERALVREIREETGIDIAPYPTELVDDLGRGTSEKVPKIPGSACCAK